MSNKEPKGLDKLGLKNIGRVFYNASYDELQAHEVNMGEAKLATSGAAMVDTGIFTGRSPKDKYFVDQAPSNQNIAWGSVNQPIKKEIYEDLLETTKEQLSGKNLYIVDAFAGSSPSSRRKIRFISEIAWQAHFVRNMFIRPTEEELEDFEPDFVMYNACKTVNKNFEAHGLRSDVYAVFNVEDNIAVIGGTWYGGEMKKGIFSMMNY